MSAPSQDNNASPTRVTKNALQVQIDEVLPDRQEEGQKMNTAYTQEKLNTRLREREE